MIVLEGVSKSFDGGRTFAVEELSLEIKEGETMILLGSSGCGKTTTLKMINRLIEPSKGKIEVGGKDIGTQNPVELRRAIGYVFQGLGLFPHMTVDENIGIVPKLLGWSADKRKKRAEELLELVGLPPQDFFGRYPDELSGGQQQRVAVARALAADPDYLLMDEPFGALDPVTRDNLQQELLEIRKRLGKTIVFVTHDIFEALTLGDRIAVMHEGGLAAVGSADDLVKGERSPVIKELFEKPARQLSDFAEML
jgi:osmoprotectant transport system ATP-binding protein